MKLLQHGIYNVDVYIGNSEPAFMMKMQMSELRKKDELTGVLGNEVNSNA